MRVGILAARTGWHTDELQRAFHERGHAAALVRYEDMAARVGARVALASGAEALDACDVVLARIIPRGSLEQIIFRVDALHALEEAGVRVVNSPRAIERTVDKFWTSTLVARHGLATPETVVCESAEAAMAGYRTLGGDVIVKPLFGSMGLGMVRVTDEDMAFRVFRTVEQLRGVYYLQRTVPHGGRDIRAFVIGGEVAGAIERRADGWRTNVSRGGSAHSVALPPEWAALAVRAAAIVGADYAGVDLLPGDDGIVYVLEVNGIPGWTGLQAATGLDVAGRLADHVTA